MLRNPHMAAAICFLAAGSLCVFATSSEAAKRSSAAAKHKSVAKQRSVTPTPKQKPVIQTDRTPTNKNDCLAVAQTLYEQAETLSKRAKQSVPREFKRVASNLDESCGEEDFGKAWISIEWMNGCLNNFNKDAELGFCTRNEGYLCAISPRSDACPKSRL
jgi:hypothetical protein